MKITDIEHFHINPRLCERNKGHEVRFAGIDAQTVYRVTLDNGIVGYGDEDGVGFYKVRNSYSADFGESGYFRISRTAGADCGMLGCVIAGTGASYLS